MIDMMNRRQLFASTSLGLAASMFVLQLRAGVAATTGAGAIHGHFFQLTEPGNADNRATFTPDGNALLFASMRSGRSQIWQIARSGGRPVQFHRSAANDYGRVAPNPDGTRVSFSSDRGGQNSVYVLDIARGAVSLVSDPSFWSFGPSWSAHDLIAFFSKRGGNSLNIWVARPDGSQAQQVTDQPGESRQPWWSPDGETLAISADHGTGKFAILLLRPDGLNTRSITSEGSCAQPFWSPDGKWIALSAKIKGTRNQIYTVESDGSMLRPIPQPEDADNVHPAWSPDGKSIVFTSGEGRASALYRYDFA
jgi:Tol biopolymer transport system component